MKRCIIQAVIAAFIWSTSFVGSHDLFAQNPLVTVRFANPDMNCTTNKYCVDVEFKSNTLGIELFGMNVRLFYDESVLEFVNFTNFQPGYSAVAPNPPLILTGSPASGPALFNFIGAAEFVNGAIQLTNASAPDIILDDWKKIFQICFTIDNAGSNPDIFCPSVVWDLEQNPANGGFLAGDDGVVITVVNPDPGIDSSPADEAVQHLNWHYIGSGTPPYGEPDQTQCISVDCCPDLPLFPNDTICDGDNMTFEYEEEGLTGVTYEWNFGSGSNPSTATGPGPHVVAYDTTLTNQATGANVTLTMNRSGCTQVSGQVSTIVVNATPDASIAAGDDTLCYYTNRTFIPAAGFFPDATYTWTFGSGAVPPSAFGYGPHTVYYQTTGIKSVKLIIDPDAPGAECADSSTQTFDIIECPGNISGHVNSVNGPGIPGVQIKLYMDFDFNGLADNGTVVKMTNTSLEGEYSLVNIVPGNYVIIQSQPAGWTSINDEDESPDGDIVINIDPLDNRIPVTVVAGTVDTDNNFIETPTPGTISGSVFVDLDGDQIPDSGEGLANVEIKLHLDANKNGIADSGVAFATAMTSGTGSYSINLIPIGNYVLTETTPAEHTSIKDYDLSNDQDSVSNSNLNNDTIPVTIMQGEHDAHNYFIDASLCPRFVTNTDDDGDGSLRKAISCAVNGDTIKFHYSLAGQTILITSTRLEIDADIIIWSNLVPTVKIKSSIPGLFDIGSSATPQFRNIHIESGVNGYIGAAFNNFGHLILHDVQIDRNPGLSLGQYLIHNNPGSQLQLRGICRLEW